MCLCIHLNTQALERFSIMFRAGKGEKVKTGEGGRTVTCIYRRRIEVVISILGSNDFLPELRLFIFLSLLYIYNVC